MVVGGLCGLPYGSKACRPYGPPSTCHSEELATKESQMPRWLPALDLRFLSPLRYARNDMKGGALPRRRLGNGGLGRSIPDYAGMAGWE